MDSWQPMQTFLRKCRLFARIVSRNSSLTLVSDCLSFELFIWSKISLNFIRNSAVSPLLLLSADANLHRRTCRWYASIDITRHHLRSATPGDLGVPRTKTVRYGPRSFAVSGPTCWNSLSSSLKSMSFSPGQFCQRMTTTLFELASVW